MTSTHHPGNLGLVLHVVEYSYNTIILTIDMYVPYVAPYYTCKYYFYIVITSPLINISKE